jgi:hypothetical protein
VSNSAQTHMMVGGSVLLWVALFGPKKERELMSNQIQAGTMMVQQSASMRSLGIESEPYSGSWRSLGVLESSGLDRKVRAAGWSLFFMAGELRAVVPAWGGQSTLRAGVKRLVAQTRLLHFSISTVSK